MEDIVAEPLESWRRITKSVLDWILAAVLIVFLCPLLLLIALAIKLQSSGPVIFRQTRHGLHNSVFHVFKFRTFHCTDMDESGSVQAQRQDPRVTRVGSFLRRASLDELPQLFNVLQGTMSLVGPRPHPIPLDDKYEKLIDGYSSRYRIRPGITGWAQVNGHRGPVRELASMQGRVDHDSYYIENWSLMLDIKILLMTIYKGLFHENAY